MPDSSLAGVCHSPTSASRHIPASTSDAISGRVAVGIHGGGQISHIGFVRERQSLGEQLGAPMIQISERSRPSSGIAS